MPLFLGDSSYKSSGGFGGESAEGGSKIYVGRLPEKIAEMDLQDLFGKYGKVQSVHLKTGFAFIEYGSHCESLLLLLHDAVVGFISFYFIVIWTFFLFRLPC